MELGVFHECHRPRSYSETDAFDEVFAHAAAAERYGFDAIWLAEIHFSPTRSVLAAPLVIAAALAARTTRLKIGTAVHVLPLSNPLRTAEEAATVDHISHGRFEFGIGRSGIPTSYERFGVPYGESRDRMLEHLDIILRAWTEDTFSFTGTYFSYENVKLIPKPYQKPHPPIRVAVNSPDTFALAGQKGWPIFVAVRLGSLEELIEPLGEYRAAWREAGHPGEGSVALRMPIFVAPTEEDALTIPRDSTMEFYRYLGGRLVDSASRAGARAIEARAERGERLGAITYEEAQRDKLAYGTPEMVIDRLQQLRESLHLSGILAEMNCGHQVPNQHILASMRLFMEKVAPALR
ncbi:MAG TPA: LLM class flavin-dependent oxidoreductase [Candidatus Methylomirabilis sp.]|nr:LLM class flavin-dependent oxidoreductase [Candidatus Methylomirabilis sp.]